MTNSTITYIDHPNRNTRWDRDFKSTLRLYNNQKGRDKALDTFRKTPYRFDFFIIPDMDAANRNSRGDDVTDLLGDHVVDPNAITSIVLHNISSDHRPLTAWMLVHRLSHAIQLFDHHNSSTRRDMQAMGPIIELYNRHNTSDQVEYDIERFIPDRLFTFRQNEKRFNRFINQLLTMRSARNGLIGYRFGGDGFGELLAQFVITGRVRLNRIEGYPCDEIESAESAINHLLGEMMDNLRGKVLAF